MMKSLLKMHRILSISLLVLTMFSCSFSDHNLAPNRANAGQTTSGIQGEALLGPIHNGPPQAGDSADVGFAALFYVYDYSGALVAKFNSDGGGWFNVALPPGHYKIIPDSSAPIWDPGQQTQPVTVTQGKFSNVILRFDQSS